MKSPFRRTKEWNVGITALIILGLVGIVIVSSYTGLVSLDGQGGYINEIDLLYTRNPESWGAVYGFAVMVSGFDNPWQYDFQGGSPLTSDSEKNLIFNCLQPNIDHELYASLVPEEQIDFGTLQAATAAEIDAFLGLDGTYWTSATKTFLDSVTYEQGITSINAPATYTYDDSGAPFSTFDLGILKDGNGNLVMVTHILENFTFGFNDRLYNYQMLLPVPNGTTQTYYFWTDPSDDCPQGQGENPNDGYVNGTVTNENGIELENVIIEVAGHTTITDSDGYYNLTVPAGDYGIYAVLTGYQVYANNVSININETITHNIILVTEEEPNDNTGVGPGNNNNPPGDGTGNGDGTGVGPGEAPEVPIVQQRPQQIEGADYIISVSEIKRKLRVENFLQQNIRIISFKDRPAEVNFEITGNVSRLISLDTESFVVDANSEKTLVLTIFGQRPVGIINGTLEISGELNGSIPIEIEVLPRDQLPVEALLLDLEVLNSNVNPGTELLFKTDLKNLLIDQEYPVNLFYSLQDLEGNTYWTFNTSTRLKTSYRLHKQAEIPDNIPLGDYVLRVTASYLGLNSASSAQFPIKATFLKYRIFNRVPVWWLLLAAGIILLGVAAYIIIKKRLEATKRYHLKVYYDELPKPGPRNVFVGKIAETETKAYFNMENFKTHTIVAGSTGGGKSFAAQGIIEGMLDKGVAVIVFDPTAQWSGMLRKLVNKSILDLYAQFGMKKTEAKAYNGNIRQITNALEIIDIKKYMKPGEIQIFAVHKLDPKDIDIFVANTIREVFHQNFDESQNLRLVLCYDEVHRLLPKFGGSGEGFLQIERGCREFRKWGIGIALISQVLADFVGQIKANINTEVQMRTRDEGDLDRIKTKYGEEVLRSLVKASVGTGMVENPAYNHGKPYFITFRPIKHSVQRLTDEELEQYNKYNDEIDQLEFELEQLEEMKVDVFDLKLELKLALDKVKSGNFNMVAIYLDGLKPRITKHWEKQGKTPKKLERKMADMAEIQASIAKAKADSAKSKEGESAKAAAATETAAAGDKKEEKKEDKFAKTVDFNSSLQFSNGAQVTTLTELMDVLDSMDPATFKESMKDKNIIYDWVKDKLAYPAFAEKLSALEAKDDFVKALNDEKANPTKEGGAAPAVKEKSGESDTKEEKKEEAPEKLETEEKPEVKKEERAEEKQEEAPEEKKEEKKEETEAAK